MPPTIESDENPYRSPLSDVDVASSSTTKPLCALSATRELERRLWRSGQRCPQCDTKVPRFAELMKCVRCGCVWKAGVDRPDALAYTLVFLPLGLVSPVMILMSVHGAHNTYGLLGVALECCFWLSAAILLFGGIIGVAALFDWGPFRPRILSAGMTPPPSKDTKS